MAGIFAAVASLISLAAASTNPVNSAYGYFGVALLVSLLCLISFIVMLRLVSKSEKYNFFCYTYTHIHMQPFVQHHLEKTTIRNQKAKKEEGELLDQW